MHIVSKSLDAAGQEPNRSSNQARQKHGVAKVLPVSTPVLNFHAFAEAKEEHQRREEKYPEFDDHQYAGDNAAHVAPKSGQHAIDPALLKALATRANDYLLLSLILVLGFIALCSIPALNRVEREFQIAARV